MNEQMKLIALLTKRLERSVTAYEKGRKEHGTQPWAGYEVKYPDSKTAIKRRIVTLREALLELSEML